ncbi:hypothetical protein HDU90_009198 [Geranomyces variabilis]|nr:hypothetical protein HDU90_009198 [Geranomyces variabilis]
MFEQLDITTSCIPGWITDFDVPLKDIYRGLTSKVVKNFEEVFGIREATNRRTGWGIGKKLTKESRPQILRQFYQFTRIWKVYETRSTEGIQEFEDAVERDDELYIIPLNYVVSTAGSTPHSEYRAPEPYDIASAFAKTEDILHKRLSEAQKKAKQEAAAAASKAKEPSFSRAQAGKPKEPSKAQVKTETTTPPAASAPVPSAPPMTPAERPKLSTEQIVGLYAISPVIAEDYLKSIQGGTTTLAPATGLITPKNALKKRVSIAAEEPAEAQGRKKLTKKVVKTKTRSKRPSKRRDEDSSSSSSSESDMDDLRGLLLAKEMSREFRQMLFQQTRPKRSPKKKSSQREVKAESTESSSSATEGGEEGDGSSLPPSETTSEETTESLEEEEEEEVVTQKRRRTTHRQHISASFLKKLRQAISKYDSGRNPQKLLNFINKVNVYVRRNPNATDNDIINIVKLKFEGAAATWWQSVQNKVKAGHKRRLKYHTWKELCLGLQQTFTPEEDAIVMRDKFSSLRQTGLVLKYNDQFRLVAEQIIGLSFQEEKHAYLKGLNPKIARLVRANPENLKTMQKLYNAAMRIEGGHAPSKSSASKASAIPEASYVDRNKPNKKPGKKQGEKNNSSTPQHGNRSEPKGDNKCSDHEKEHKCGLCNNKGHYEQNCRTAKKAIKKAKKDRPD